VARLAGRTGFAAQSSPHDKDVWLDRVGFVNSIVAICRETRLAHVAPPSSKVDAPAVATYAPVRREAAPIADGQASGARQITQPSGAPVTTENLKLRSRFKLFGRIHSGGGSNTPPPDGVDGQPLSFSASSAWGVSTWFGLQIAMILRSEQSFAPHTARTSTLLSPAVVPWRLIKRAASRSTRFGRPLRLFRRPLRHPSNRAGWRAERPGASHDPARHEPTMTSLSRPDVSFRRVHEDHVEVCMTPLVAVEVGCALRVSDVKVCGRFGPSVLRRATLASIVDPHLRRERGGQITRHRLRSMVSERSAGERCNAWERG
jgi:hypothetical protein